MFGTNDGDGRLGSNQFSSLERSRYPTSTVSYINWNPNVMNERTSSSRWKETVLLMKPTSFASSGPNSRAVKAHSRTAEWFPTIFPILARVPISAARPTSTSCDREQREDKEPKQWL